MTHYRIAMRQNGCLRQIPLDVDARRLGSKFGRVAVSAYGDDDVVLAVTERREYALQQPRCMVVHRPQGDVDGWKLGQALHPSGERLRLSLRELGTDQLAPGSNTRRQGRDALGHVL